MSFKINDSIFKITSQCSTGSDGINSFLVLLGEGGKKVKRTRAELEKLAPELLKSFEAKAIDITSSSGDDSDIEIIDSPPAPRKQAPPSSDNPFSVVIPVKNKSRQERREEREEEEERARRRKLKGKGKEVVVIDSDEDESSNNDAASFEEGSNSSASDSEEDSDGSASDSDRRRKKNKTRQEPTRKSSRTNRHKKNFHRESDGGQTSSESNKEDFVRRTIRLIKPVHENLKASNASDHTDTDSSDEMTLKTLLPGMKSTAKKSSQEKKKGGKSTEDESDAYSDTYQDRSSSDSDESELVQLEHRKFCKKCDKGPAAGLLAKFYKKPPRKRKRDLDEEDTDQEEERLNKLGAWMECNVCIDAYHFNCLPSALRKEVVDGLKAKHEALHQKSPETENDASTSKVSPQVATKIPKRKKIEEESGRVMSLPKCWSCKKSGGRTCFVCHVNGRKKLSVIEKKSADLSNEMEVDSPRETRQEVPGFLFRCNTCTRVCHYDCLEKDQHSTAQVLFEHYFGSGECHDCVNYDATLDVILAWAEGDSISNSSNDVEAGDVRNNFIGTKKKDDEGKSYILPNHKDPSANAKYLVKWQDQSYRRVTWVNHGFLAAKFSIKLKNFLLKGSSISFDPASDEDEKEDGEDENEAEVYSASPQPDPDVLSRIPPAWFIVDRILEVEYRSPAHVNRTIPHRSYPNLPSDPEVSIKRVAKCYFKWRDLPYSASTIEEPPKAGEAGYAEYKQAYKFFLLSRAPEMMVPNLNASQQAELNRPRHSHKFKLLKSQPENVTGGKLMDFQLEGVNFLYHHWWTRTGAILADEMGLGKTVQIIALLAHLSFKEGARPFLVAVPNSTIGNWMREFAKWAPNIRVVSFTGDQVSRTIIENYELFDHSKRYLKTQVVVATYEAIANQASVFRRVTRWDTLVVDEGQRLKGGQEGLLWKALNSLNINLRILLSGTPMQNNIRELFNMLQFVDSTEYPDVKALEAKYSVLTPAVIEEIRGLLKPYFLRRTKKMVLNLPPMTQIVLPVTLTAVQRTIYQSILKRNVSSIEAIFHAGAGKGAKIRKQNLNNAFMEMRKLLGHPYLLSADMERTDIPEAEQQQQLIQTSAKLILLEKLLPKLRAGGHRVLIFSQFKIVLNILESFLNGLRIKFLRLDGNTPSLDRQRGMDAFNAKDSNYFCYLISTRAGGAGINLATADTVILYDQDFNPQQDLQATSRAHRIGQTKPVRVFKLLCKGTCEEKMFKSANKKLGLDHLIIQRIDATDDEIEDVEGVLQFGAEAMFDDEAAEAQAIRYTDQDIEKILASEPVKEVEGEDSSTAFFSAKIWDFERGNEGELEEDTTDQATDGTFWTNLLKETEEANALAIFVKEANVGRGKRNRANVAYDEKHDQIDHSSPKKLRTASDSDADFATEEASEEDEDDVDASDVAVDNSLLEKQPRTLEQQQLQQQQVPLDPNAPPVKPKRIRTRRVKSLPSTTTDGSVIDVRSTTSAANVMFGPVVSEYNRLQLLQRVKEQDKREQILLKQQQELEKERIILERHAEGGPSLAEFKANEIEREALHQKKVSWVLNRARKVEDAELQGLIIDATAASPDRRISQAHLEKITAVLDRVLKRTLQRRTARAAIENALSQPRLVSQPPRAPSSITNGQKNATASTSHRAWLPNSTTFSPSGTASAQSRKVSSPRESNSTFFVNVPQAARGGIASPGRRSLSTSTSGSNSISMSRNGSSSNAPPVPPRQSPTRLQKELPTSSKDVVAASVAKIQKPKEQVVVQKKVTSTVIDLTLDSDSD